MSNPILELLQIGTSKSYEFNFKIIDEKINILNLDYDNKIINVEIGDPNDEELPKMIEDLKEKLQ